MRHILRLLFLLLAVCLLAATTAGQYLWFTNTEMTVFGDPLPPFGTGDTVDGPVRSNGPIVITGSPVFLDRFITCASDWIHDVNPHPQFLGPPPQFNADSLILPRTAEHLREAASHQGRYFHVPGTSWRARFDGASVNLCWWPTGTIYDSIRFITIPLADRTCIFIDGPLDVCGVVEGQVTIGCSRTLRILDDIRYVDASPLDGRLPDTNGDGIPESGNLLGLVSEEDIKVANTPANGRWNSDSLGYEQTDPSKTSVVITAALRALGGSFTFEQQNDPDSGYVYTVNGIPHRDDRGTIYIFGSLMQNRRGYMHRSTNGSTGYLKHCHYDRRLNSILPPGSFDYDEPYTLSDDTLNFGNVALDSVAWDTLEIETAYPMFFAGAYASLPFHPESPPMTTGERFIIPVRFTPSRVGPFSGSLSFTIGSHFLQIPLRGRGVAAGASLAMALAPNPCNLSTTLRYLLPVAGRVRLTLYDILGRTARQIDIDMQPAGEHTLHLDLSGLASGVYFTQLEAADQRLMHKLLLLK